MSSETRRAAMAGIQSALPHSAPEQTRNLPLSDLYGSHVFNDRAMRERLPRSSYEALQRTIREGHELDPVVAEVVAAAMKEWAVEKGATHYTHWFQPMTGFTAEKHDAFLAFADDRLILEFSGKALIKGEPDASSFPSGGIRSTFEARGYTAWDPTSPAFVREGENGGTLCIPTAFCSWTGEALDKKTPLLRSTEVLSREAVRMLRLLGDRATDAVHPTLGCEQEFFVIDRKWFLARPDLVATGRTLVGARPPKGQELEDHYFGSMTPRVLAFIQEVERELWKLGVPMRTRHNEVAPSQFEMAPIYEHAQIATDHNLLTMEVLRTIAPRHGLTCLLHEKPFAGINGSGKHNNWSLETSAGENLLDPGDTPAENARFLVFLTAILRGLDRYGDLLRAGIALAGNDHRLGANEAPPAIMSVYLGEELDAVIRDLIGIGGARREHNAEMRLGVSTLPPLPRDATDRNRTSPFAFTGNKFELRAAGASQSPATPALMVNTMVADSLRAMADEIERRRAEGQDPQTAIQATVQETLKRHHRVVFNGDNYAAEWVEEAQRRGLANLRNTPDALTVLDEERTRSLFESLQVLSATELRARSNIWYERYCKALAIEAQTLLEIASTLVLPAAIRHQGRIAEAISRGDQLGLPVGPQREVLEKTATNINELIAAIAELQGEAEAAETRMGDDIRHSSRLFLEGVLPAMERIRTRCDALETQVDDDLWPLPRYREMLFVH